MNLISFLSIIWIFFHPVIFSPKIEKVIPEQNPSATEWVVAELLQPNKDVNIVGNPTIISCKYGKAVLFNGKDDGIFIDKMPLNGLSAFTIEILVRFDNGGDAEQRFFHCGEVQGDRVLLEMRSTPTSWYLDGFIQSGNINGALISPELVHPLDEWHHIAFEVQDGKQTTFINSKKELEKAIEFKPISKGATSIGVRQNKISWFKGAIYKIRITDKVLQPSEFMKD